MKKKKWNRAFTALLVIAMAISLLSGCGEKKEEKEEKDKQKDILFIQYRLLLSGKIGRNMELFKV